MSSALDLSEAQVRVVRPDIERIAVAVEDYDADVEAFAETMPTQRPAGGRGSGGGSRETRRAKMQEDLQRLNAKRAAYQAVIDRAVDAIITALDEDQREVFAAIDRPDLELPEMPSRGGGGRGGGGGRAGGGRGGGSKGGGLGGGIR